MGGDYVAKIESSKNSGHYQSTAYNCMLMRILSESQVCIPAWSPTVSHPSNCYVIGRGVRQVERGMDYGRRVCETMATCQASSRRSSRSWHPDPGPGGEGTNVCGVVV